MDLKSLLRNHGVGFIVVSGSDEIRLQCPECGDAKNKLYFNTRVNLGICHRCNLKVNMTTLFRIFGLGGVSAFNNRSLDELKDAFRKQSEIRVKKEVTRKVRLPAVCIDIDQYPKAASYLVKRGVTSSLVRRFGIKFCIEGAFAGRIMIPITDPKGETVGYVGRDLYDRAERKYMYSKGCQVSRVLFNYPALCGRKNYAVLVEGVFDVLRHAERLPIMATFGKHLSVHQEKLLASYGVQTVVLMYDPDAIGDMEQLAALLCKSVKVKVVALEQDPDEYSTLQLEELIALTPVWGSFEHKLQNLEIGT